MNTRTFFLLICFASCYSAFSQKYLYLPSGSAAIDNTISGNYKVGIGTNDPKETLHINGSIRGNQNGALRISTGYGYIDVGPKNSGEAGFFTDKSYYMFDKSIKISAGQIGSANGNFDIKTGTLTRIYILASNGNVGIGTLSPGDHKLLVAGKFAAVGSYNGDMVSFINNQPNLPENTDLIWGGFNVSQVNNPRLFSLTSNGNFRFAVRSNGQVGVNCNPPTNSPYMLSVNGKIAATEINVKAYPFADFVFNDDYKLLPLSEVEAFIKTNKHLPDVPSEAAVKDCGIDLGEMNRILLQKIEEISLYIIEQNKRIETLELQNKELASKVGL